MISIIIAARNEEKHLAECLDSLLAQSYKDYELLIIDGESTDKTKAIALSYAKKHKNIHVLSNPDQRAAEARNIGIRNAKGELIGYIDAHTVASKDWLKTLHGTLSKHTSWNGRKVGAVGSVHRNPDKNPFTTALTDAYSHPFGGGATSYSEKGGLEAVSTAYACLYRREALEAAREKDGTYYDPYFVKGQDAELNYRINKAGYAILREPKAITYYYKRESTSAYWRQVVVAAFWRAKITKKHPRSFRAALWAPLGMLALYTALLIGGLLLHLLWTILAGLILIYVIIVFTGSLAMRARYPVQTTSMVLMAHLGYALGLLKGMFLKENKTRDRV